ncbi:MAG: putative ankyrin repeat-containing protein [candidate division TM6 bacterium GW2011_GWF2_36_6]|nr:MAG: putative ankyrin repeat-containing protein [candidate division TM6 bacterium GW2011_GWF2_36_6]
MLVNRRDCASFLNRPNQYQYNDTPLHIAVDHQRMDVVRLLIKAGADVNARNGNGETLLTVALRRARTIIASMLREAGVAE